MLDLTDCSGRMARGDKSSGSGTGSNANPAGASFLDWFFRPSMLLRASLVAGVCAVWPYMAQKLPSLSGRAEYRLAFHQIQVTPPPSRPVPENLVQQVEELSELPSDFSLLDNQLTSEVMKAFRRHPWISNVVRVQKSFPASVVVQVQYRRPVAMVEIAAGRVPIDVHAVVLPSADFSASEASQFPLIRNVASVSPAQPGMTWNNPGLIAAARMAALLEDRWKALRLEAIVIPRNVTSATDPTDIPLELVALGGSKILWGRAPGNDHPGELDATQKIRRLEKYLADFGDYSKPNGPYEIDIRHWQEISRRPLSSQQANSSPVKTPREPRRTQISEGKKKTRS